MIRFYFLVLSGVKGQNLSKLYLLHETRRFRVISTVYFLFQFYCYSLHCWPCPDWIHLCLLNIPLFVYLLLVCLCLCEFLIYLCVSRWFYCDPPVLSVCFDLFWITVYAPLDLVAFCAGLWFWPQPPLHAMLFPMFQYTNQAQAARANQPSLLF